MITENIIKKAWDTILQGKSVSKIGASFDSYSFDAFIKEVRRLSKNKKRKDK